MRLISAMASVAESRMNLASVQQRDPYITEIIDTASQVALYSFSSQINEWEKTDIEGTLFVYTRSASPTNGFMILNRLGLNDRIEPINKNLEFQLQDPFLLYKNAQAIYGIWFYDKDECAKIGQLMNSLVQIAIETHERKDSLTGRQRRASESDTMIERVESVNMNKQPNVDILQILSKAQDEYDKSKTKQDPKPLMDNSRASSSAVARSATLIKPLARKIGAGDDCNTASDSSHVSAANIQGGGGDPGASSGTSTLDALFRRASLQQGPGTSTAETQTQGKVFRSQSVVEAVPTKGLKIEASANGGSGGNNMPRILQRLMSQPGATVEEIERGQHNPVQTTNGESNDRQARLCDPESPNTALKRTLNILPVSSSSKGTKNGMPGVGQSLPSKSHHATAKSIQEIPTEKAKPLASLSQSFNESQINKAKGFIFQRQLSGGAAITTASMSSGGTHPICSSPVDTLSASFNSSGSKSNLGAGLSGGLMTPEALTGTKPKAATGVMKSSVSNALQVNPTTSVLLSPSVFEQSSQSQRHSPPQLSSLPAPSVFHAGCDSSSAHSTSPLSIGDGPNQAPQISLLTKEQLLQAMTYLLKNDPNFITTLHEAYVKSLNELATQFHFKS